ncbi:MAG: F0F1 ATP synthase subunit epsilon [Nitrospirota bacterium]
MTGRPFDVEIITPLQTLTRKVRHIRLEDETGYFGVMRGHMDFVTVLQPSVGYYSDVEGREVFLAVEGGVLLVRDGRVTLTSRGVFENTDPEKLKQTIEESMKRKERSEAAYASLVRGLERAFLEKSVEMERSK